MVLTKLDGTAKGGVALGIHRALGLPIRYVGVGEGDGRPAALRPRRLRRGAPRMSSAAPRPAEDRRWMEQALALAALGEGTTSPNPRVGCLLVREGRVVGSGYHRAYGAPHAEAVALERAGPRARGATAYVNLEPCAHEGHTPPCADLLAGQGVERVVAALRDPNPLVDGRGHRALARCGRPCGNGSAG